MSNPRLLWKPDVPLNVLEFSSKHIKDLCWKLAELHFYMYMEQTVLQEHVSKYIDIIKCVQTYARSSEIVSTIFLLKIYLSSFPEYLLHSWHIYRTQLWLASSAFNDNSLHSQCNRFHNLQQRFNNKYSFSDNYTPIRGQTRVRNLICKAVFSFKL